VVVSSRTTLAAHTPPGLAPPYINISLVNGFVEVAVRSTQRADGSYHQPQAMISLDPHEWARLIGEAALTLPVALVEYRAATNSPAMA
jgi:hypothetical protein